ncbi:MAG: ABC transporter permease [Firmicutes bacterium]|jgi:osmoprotectant transport system permease protein|nr:ABC transporter permease [Bacillota bacterium]
MTTLVKFWEYMMTHSSELLLAIQEHMLLLVALPVAMATLVAVPVGILCTRRKWLESSALGITGVIQTIPSLALLAFMITLGFGIGYRPAVVAIFLYALLPILRNTYTGLKSVDPFMKKAARGMGMTDFQCLVMVELPIAIPVILAGIRTSTIISIGTGTLAAFVGAGGLGHFIVTGLRMVRDHIILAGAVPAAVMALLVDFLLNRVEKWITPRGLRI